MKGQFCSSDAYAVIEVNGQKVAWTHPVFSTLDPVWNEKFFFRNVPLGSQCKLYLFDKDVNADDELGETQFTIVDTDNTESTCELAITFHGKKAGTIVVKVCVINVEALVVVLLCDL